MKKTRKKGAITVEATLIMPFYILLLAFLINLLNIFYVKLAVQNGLNNAATTMAQYCYAIDLTLGMDKLAISDSTSQKAMQLADDIDDFSSSAQAMAQVFEKKLSVAMLEDMIDKGGEFLNSTKQLKNTLANIEGEDVANYLLTGGAELGGGFLVKVMVENYLDDMKISRAAIEGDIEYNFYVDASHNYDLVLTADYHYGDTLFSAFGADAFVVHQQVVVHPWIGGESDGLRKIS